MAKGERHNISHREEAVITALLETRTVRDASYLCGVGETTIYRYLKKDSFLVKFKERREQIISSLVDRLQSASHVALDELLRIVADPKAKEHNKVTACKTILDTAVRSIEINKLMDIEARLEELEHNGGVSRAV